MRIFPWAADSYAGIVALAAFARDVLLTEVMLFRPRRTRSASCAPRRRCQRKGDMNKQWLKGRLDG
jgi:hypothetical protein